MIIGMNRIIHESKYVLMAVFSTVALFADVVSTGNMSMALNGDGIPQLMAFIILIYAYRKVWESENSFLKKTGKREKTVAAVISVIFSICMIIGKAQTAHEDLKYPIFAVAMFAGYLPLFYVIVAFLEKLLADHFGKQVTDDSNNKAGKITKWIFEDHVILGVMLIVILCRLPYLIAFYPCSMSWDGGAQICNFYGREIFTNHHPPLLSYFYGAIAWYSQEWGIPNIGMFMIPLIQTLLSAFAAAKVCELFKDLKTPYWVRWSSLIYYAAFTVWCIFDCTVIKDTMYYPFTMLFTVQAIYCFIDSKGFFQKKKNLFLMILYGVMMSEVRNNGIFVLIFTMPLLIIVVKKRKKLILGLITAISLMIVFTLDNCVYPSLGVVKLEAKVDTYCMLFQQTAEYAAKHPEDVTPEEREFLNTMFDYDEMAKVYNPRLADWVKNCLRIQEGSDEDPTSSTFASTKKEYLHIWFAQFLRHPLTYIDTFFKCSYGYYYPEVGVYKEGMGFYEMDRHMFTEGMHAAAQIESLAPARFILEQISKLEYVPGIGLLYKCGFYTWAVIFAAGYLIARRRYVDIIAVIPAIVNILVCLVSPVNTCIRYAMPTMCMLPVIFAIIYGYPHEIDNKEENML